MGKNPVWQEFLAASKPYLVSQVWLTGSPAFLPFVGVTACCPAEVGSLVDATALDDLCPM
jgi:hypothetical protein